MAAQDALSPQVSYPTILPYPPAREPHVRGALESDVVDVDKEPDSSLKLSPISVSDSVIVPNIYFQSNSFSSLFHLSEDTFHCDECEDEYEEPGQLVKHYLSRALIMCALSPHCNIDYFGMMLL